jgi:chromosome segregation ATPase
MNTNTKRKYKKKNNKTKKTALIGGNFTDIEECNKKYDECNAEIVVKTNEKLSLEEKIDSILEKLRNQDEQLRDQSQQLRDQSQQLRDQGEQLRDQGEQLRDQDEQLSDQDEQLRDQKDEILGLKTHTFNLQNYLYRIKLLMSLQDMNKYENDAYNRVRNKETEIKGKKSGGEDTAEEEQDLKNLICEHRKLQPLNLSKQEFYGLFLQDRINEAHYINAKVDDKETIVKKINYLFGVLLEMKRSNNSAIDEFKDRYGTATIDRIMTNIRLFLQNTGSPFNPDFDLRDPTYRFCKKYFTIS